MRLIYDASDYNSIRLLVDSMLTEEILSDATISDTIYLGAGEDWAYDQYPGAFELIGEDEETLRRAIYYMTASFILQNSPYITSGKMNEQAFTLVTGDYERRASRMQRMAWELLMGLEGGEVVPASMPTQFYVATARRTRW